MHLLRRLFISQVSQNAGLASNNVVDDRPLATLDLHDPKVLIGILNWMVNEKATHGYISSRGRCLAPATGRSSWFILSPFSHPNGNLYLGNTNIAYSFDVAPPRLSAG